MKEYSNNRIAIAALLLLGFFATSQVPKQQSDRERAFATVPTPTLVQTNSQLITETASLKKAAGPSLKLSITVNDPSHLKVHVGQKIKVGQVISDNTVERGRLLRQRKSIELQIQNLKSKSIPKPAPPTLPPPLSPLPRANFAEEQAAIAQAEMKFASAQSTLTKRLPILGSDSPERKAEASKAEAALSLTLEKVQEQEQLLQHMKDMQMPSSIVQHEEAKLMQLQSEYSQAQSVLEQAKAKLKASFIEQQQQVQSLQTEVKLAQSDLQLSKSRFSASITKRQLLEYQASLDAARRVEEANVAQQNYVRASQEYAQMVRERDYQLAQLSLSLSGIDDKLAQIPFVRSPRDGFIRRVKPWVGNNGKYTTVVIISNSSSRNANTDGSSGANTTPHPTTASPTNSATTATSDE